MSEITTGRAEHYNLVIKTIKETFSELLSKKIILARTKKSYQLISFTSASRVQFQHGLKKWRTLNVCRRGQEKSN